MVPQLHVHLMWLLYVWVIPAIGRISLLFHIYFLLLKEHTETSTQAEVCPYLSIHPACSVHSQLICTLLSLVSPLPLLYTVLFPGGLPNKPWDKSSARQRPVEECWPWHGRWNRPDSRPFSRFFFRAWIKTHLTCANIQEVPRRFRGALEPCGYRLLPLLLLLLARTDRLR